MEVELATRAANQKENEKLASMGKERARLARKRLTEYVERRVEAAAIEQQAHEEAMEFDPWYRAYWLSRNMENIPDPEDDIEDDDSEMEDDIENYDSETETDIEMETDMWQ